MNARRLRPLVLAAAIFAAATPAMAAPGAWGPFTGPTGGQLNGVAFGPAGSGTAYAASSLGGVWRSADGGVSWARRSSGLPGIQAMTTVLAGLPGEPNTLFAGTSNAKLHRSTDGGLTWSPRSAGIGEFNVTDIVAESTVPGTLYAAIDQFGGGPGVYKTVDAGATWTPSGTGLTGNGLRVQDLARTPGVPTRLYAATLNGVYVSTTAGGSWAPSSTGITTTTVRSIAIDPDQVNVVYAGTDAGVFKSVDSGANWAPLAASPPQVNAVVLEPGNGGVVWAACGLLGVYRSPDGGATWTPRNTGLQDGVPGGTEQARTVFELAISAADPSVMLAATLAGPFRSNDGGATWTSTDGGMVNQYVRGIAVEHAAPATAYAATDRRGVWRTTDGGASWQPANQGLNEPIVNGVATHPASPGLVIAVTQGRGAFRSADGGGSWTQSTGLSGASLFLNAAAPDPATPGRFLLATQVSGVFRSDDGGQSWTASNTGIPGAGVSDIAFAAGGGPVFAATSSGIARSTDGGLTWTAPSGTGLLENPTRVATHPTDPLVGWAGSSQRAYRTVDGGATWVPSSTGLPNPAVVSDIVVDPADPSTLYLTRNGDDGVYRSVDSGQSWSPFADGVTHPYGRGLAVDRDASTLWLATEGGGAGAYRLQADLSLTASSQPAAVTVGATVTHVLRVQNGGPRPATRVRVTEAFPAGMEVVSATSTQGSCALAQTVACEVGTLPVGAAADVTVVARAAGPGVLTATAAATAPQADATPVAPVSLTTTATVPPVPPATVTVARLSSRARVRVTCPRAAPRACATTIRMLGPARPGARATQLVRRVVNVPVGTTRTVLVAPPAAVVARFRAARVRGLPVRVPVSARSGARTTNVTRRLVLPVR